MTSTFEFVAQLDQQDIKLWLDGDLLRINAPEGTLSATLIYELKKRKMEIVDFLRQHQSGLPVTTIQRVPRQDQEPLPLSFAQQRLWFLAQLEDASSTYNISVALRLDGWLDVAAFEASWQALSERHEALRTTFPSVDGQPYQQINPVGFNLHLIDLSALSIDDKEAKVASLAQQEGTHAFDLTNGPLWRVTLLRLQEDSHVLLLTMHHIISDGWSMGVLIREFSALYEQKRMTEVVTTAHVLPELPIHYADFAVWQREWLQGQVLETQLAYWKEQLANAEPLLTLPTDHTRPTVQRYRGNHLSFALSGELYADLVSLSQQNNTTLFMTLQAAFAVLLSRYSGQKDILIGTPIANRQIAEVENLIGFFINTLVLRNDLSAPEEQPLIFREFLSRVHETAVDAYQHQALPFELLVETLQPKRSLSHSPLFQVMFRLDNNPQDALFFSGLTVTPIEIENPVAKFDLTLAMQEQEDGLVASWEYNTDLFEKNTIARMAGHFETLLEGIVANPDQAIAHLPLLTESERHQLLVEWNDTQTAYPKAAKKCIHHLFEEQVVRSPDAIAVIFPAMIEGEQRQVQQLTYRQLNARANHLAHHLIGLGVGPESLVGLYVERSLEMVVGLLAILKAGGAYVPLDPMMPRERLRMMLEDTPGEIVVTQQHLLANLPHVGKRPVCLDDELAFSTRSHELNPIGEAMPKNLAYILYTSGSTGKPKGVAVEHRQVMAYGQAVIERCELEAGMRYAMVQPLTVDSCVTMLFPSLWTGGVLHVIDRDLALDANALAATFQRFAIDCLKIAPSHLSALLSAASEPEAILPKKRLIIGGEASKWKWMQELVKQGSCQVYNHYGPTETTVGVLTYQMSKESTTQTSHTAPIGRPLANTQAYILDPLLQPVPIGCSGELHIGGQLVTRGYLNRPDLSRERFIRSPFAPNGQPDYLYKTGDWARYLPDGNIEFFGRMDGQVKIRGFRIELGEIEAQLRSHAHIRETLVIARENESGEKQLVAYVVAKSKKHDEEKQWGTILRDYLKQKLPDYMIPSAFVLLDALPLSAHGKINRRALPAPSTVMDVEKADLILPRTPTEEILAAILQDVLGIEQADPEHRRRISIHDNFFEIGGHSLLATQVVSRIRQSLQVELPLRRLFAAPTIAQLAQELSSTEQVLPPLKPLYPIERVGPLPLSFAQQRLWFLAQLEGTTDAYHIPVALRLDGPLDLAAFNSSWQQLEERHEALRTSFPIVDGQACQQINAPSFKLTLIDLCDWPAYDKEPEAMRLAQEESTRSFDLMNGPLWRVSLLRLEQNSHVLLLTMHHIISDGWSIDILVREFSTLYAQMKATEAGPDEGKVATTGNYLPALPVQYADFAVWQRSWLQGELLQTQLHYWKKQLADAPPLLNLPTDYARPAIQRYRGDGFSFKLPKALSKELASLSDRNSTTLFMTLQAAFAVLLSRYSGQEDILIGIPIANRPVTNVENLIGFFVNTLILRNDLSAPEGQPLRFRDLLTRVRQTALDAYQQQALPFELLVETLKPERSLSYSPLFQVMFTLENQKTERTLLSDITVSPIKVEYPIAKFDLTLAMQVQEEGLLAWWEYDTDLFERATIERMARHFQTLLEGIVANPNESIARLPLLTESEKYKLLVEWNDTATDYPSDQCIHQLFEQQVRRTPEAIAVVFGNEQLTYEQLNVRANQLAHYLITQGVGPDVLVGICVERSVDMVVGLLGILKAGGAYVPLDPSYPYDRLEFILEDANVKMLLTEQKLAATLPHSYAQVNLDQDCWYGPDHSNPITRVRPDNLVYCIYTSGSTGQPKAVLIPHSGLLNLVFWHQQAFAVTAQDHATQLANMAFDASVWEIWPYLAAGARLYLVDSDVLSVPAQLQAWLLSNDITITFLPTPLAEMVLALEWPSEAPLRTMLTGGDKLRHFPNQSLPFQLVNNYGPTEYSVVTTSGIVCANERPVPSIGRPIANTQVYILDHNQHPVPIGVAGELYIGGAGIARGYKDRPKLTDERFISNPFAAKGVPSKLYRTGDLCRYLPDTQGAGSGNIEFLGRVDYQVKIRGFRIELGEIETVLGQLPGVREAIVVVADSDSASGVGKRLVACLVMEDHLVGELPSRALLRQKLPDYMIPNLFVRLSAMPLTPNGKIDRRALSDQMYAETSDLLCSTSFMAPRNQTERQLVSIWQEVLGVHAVGVQDSFFDLGGHSLLAVQLMAQIRQHFAVNLPLAMLFEHNTIDKMAIKLAEQSNRAKVDWSVLVPIQPNGDKLPFFCVPGAGGNIIGLYDLARFMGAQQPFYGLQAIGLDGETAPYTTIEAIAAHNIKAIQDIQPQGPYLLGGHSFGGYVAFEMAQQLLKAGHEVANLIIFDVSAPTPCQEFNETDWDEAKWLISYAETISKWVGQETMLSYDALLPLHPEEQLRYFKEELERLNLWPIGSDLKQLRGLVQVLKANSMIRYMPDAVIRTPITLFRTQEKRPSNAETEPREEPTYGWQPFASGQVEVISVPGNHISMMTPPHIEVLAKHLRESLHNT